MKKTIIIISIIAAASLLTAVLLGIALGGGSTQIVTGGTTGTSATTGGISGGVPEINVPEPTPEEYFTFKYYDMMNMQTGEDCGYYSISAKSVENLPETIVIPNEYLGRPVSQINNESFAGAKIKKIFIGKNINYLGIDVFKDNTELEEVIFLGNNLYQLHENCFSDCENLKKVIFANGGTLYYIKKSAFENCKNLEELILPDNIMEIADTAFSGCAKLKITFSSNELFENNENCFIDKENKTLLWCKSEKYIPTDGSVTAVGSFFFLESDGITEYTIPDFVEKIGEGAFIYCHSLKSITLSAKMKVVPQNAFKSLENLKKVNLSSVETIETSAFDSLPSLSEIIWSENLKSLSSFNSCVLLQSADIPKSVTTLTFAFNDCPLLSQITFSKKAGTIVNSFNNCHNIKEVIFPESLTTIRASFQNCDTLKKVVFPQTISILSQSFSDCALLSEISLPEKAELFTGSFNSLPSLTEIEIHKIDSFISSFKDCMNLKSVSISAYSTKIYSGFSGAPFLYDIYYNGTMDEWKNHAIGIAGQLTIHCTDGELKLYS